METNKKMSKKHLCLSLSNQIQINFAQKQPRKHFKIHKIETKMLKNNTVFNLPQVKLDLSSNEQPDYSSFPNQFIRESPKHKTSPPTYKNRTIRKPFSKEISEFVIYNDDVKYSKTTPLTIISHLYNFKMINSNQRGYLKELIFENNQLLTECINKYQLDGSLEKLYENISFLLKG